MHHLKQPESPLLELEFELELVLLLDDEEEHVCLQKVLQHCVIPLVLACRAQLEFVRQFEQTLLAWHDAPQQYVSPVLAYAEQSES